MRARLYGEAGRPSAVVIGAWDPLVPSHRQLFDQLTSYSRGEALRSVVVLLDPAPPLFVWGRHDWPVFDDVWTRLAFVFDCGVDAVLLVRFTRADLDAGAAEFFAFLTGHLTIAELWLGFYQTLGTGPRGATAAIDEQAKEHGIRLLRLPPLRLETEDVRRLLAAGRVLDASRVVGRPPVRRRPRSLVVRLAWRPGRYWVMPLASPASAPHGRPLAVDLVAPPKGLPRLQWPDRAVRYLAFVAGPGDDLTDADSIIERIATVASPASGDPTHHASQSPSRDPG